MKNTLIMKQPSGSYGEPWREATPLGNGLTGALLYGGTATEQVIFNRYDCWHNGYVCDVPDVTEAFAEMRKKMDTGDYFGASGMVCKALSDKGYHPNAGTPFPLGTLRIDTNADGLFKHYSRKLHMDTAKSSVCYDEKGGFVKREAFISRADDIFAYRFTSECAKKYRVSLNCHLVNKPDAFFERIKDTLSVDYSDGFAILKAENSKIHYGIAVYVPGSTAVGNALEIESDGFVIYAKCFSSKEEFSAEVMRTALVEKELSFDKLLEEHIKCHRALYDSADLDISEETCLSNEQLLADAYEEEASPELLEKLWRYGRYLFICGTHKDGIPFPLYGLWAGTHEAMWAQYVCNENVQISYWHALCGNLAGLVKPLIRFFCSDMEIYRKAARNIFGCSGIFVSVYSSPLNKEPYPVVPVIIHYISCAGWLCSHFYNYYKATDDKEYLDKYILPFMIESAKFYLDYAKYDDNGKMTLYPSVSPENSPKNFINEKSAHMAHPMPTAKNATMDFAILKELLTNLISLAKEADVGGDFVKRCEKALSAIPQYPVNEKGAVCEWMHKDFEDNYYHRHLSHIYPLFPGNEINRDSEIYPAFKKAVDLRELGAQSGWSLAHMSGIYCAMGEGERALECLDILSKSCLLDNFFTLHNDYRYTGLTLDMGYVAPVQLDASLGAVNALQMMLMQWNGRTLYLLPALPERLKKGAVKGFAFDFGAVDFKWDIIAQKINAEITVKRSGSFEVKLPKRFGKSSVSVNGIAANRGIISVQTGDVITIT